jgi:hypothetical protein
VDLLLRILQSEPLLENLQKAQKLDTLDIEAIYYLHKRLNSTDEVHCNQDAHGTSPSLQLLIVVGSIVDEEQVRLLDAMKPEEAKSKISDFLIAAAAKDCSIMVTLLPVAK